MKTQVKEVHSCDYCKKHLFVRHAMAKHEVKCVANPANFSACVGCVNLAEIKIPYIQSGFFDGYAIEENREANGFYCEKLKQKMYPVKAKHKGLPEKYPETFEDQICMPVRCEHQDFGFNF